MFFCGFCKIFKNKFFTEHIRATASVVEIIIPWIKASRFIFKGRIANFKKVPLFSIREMLIKLTQSYRERQIELPVTIKLIAATRKKQRIYLPVKEVQKQPPEVLYRKRCSQNFAKFTGKHLHQSLFFNKVAGLKLYLKRDSGTGVFL